MVSERVKAKSRRYYKKHSTVQKAKALTRYELNRRKNLLQMAIRHKEKRQAVFDLLGGAKCKRCSIADIDVLQFDHVRNDGFNLRKIETKKTRYKYWLDHPKYTLKHIQILCANCNWKKRAMKERDEIFAI